MKPTDITALGRRGFLKQIGSAAAIAGVAKGQPKTVSIVVEPEDVVASSAPARWAIQTLQDALAARGVTVVRRQRITEVASGELCVLAAGPASTTAQSILKSGGIAMAAAPEALALAQGRVGGRQVVLAAGHDPRGLVYALTELSDRVLLLAEPLAALNVGKAIAEKPMNPVRSITRLFVTEVEDKTWFNDREMWPRYLSMLATQRFNRFNLSLGIGYDFLRQVTDAYFLFAYPFLIDVPGYKVRAVNLPDAERDRNLELLKYISEQSANRGIDFQLGIWMHGYRWPTNPRAQHTIEGITAEGERRLAVELRYRF